MEAWLPTAGLICERVEESTAGSQPSYFTVLTSGVNPWMRTSSLSPEVMGPTPLGVPVRIMSPGSRVRLVEIKLTRWKQSKMSWLVCEF